MIIVKQIKEAGKKAGKQGAHVYLVKTSDKLEFWVNSASLEKISMGTPVIKHFSLDEIEYDRVYYNNTFYTLQDFVDEINKDYAYLELVDVLTCPEAAKQWGITEDKVKRYARDGKFTEEEARRSGKYWLITRQGMERVFGKVSLD